MAGDDATGQVLALFSVTDILQCREKLGKCSEDLERFADGFQTLTIVFDLTR